MKSANTRAIEAQTDTNWDDWCAFLDGAQANTLDHNGIVKKAHGFRDISGWWAQEIAVAYEQHIGRRKPGQTSDGLFSASASHTIGGEVGGLHAAWCEFSGEVSAIDDVGFAQLPTTSVTPKRLYWRCRFEDGSAASVSFEQKSGEKVLVLLEHRKLRQETEIAAKKQAWRALFAECFGVG